MQDLDIRIDIDDKAIDPNEVSFWLTVSAISSFLIWGTFVVFYFSRLSAIFCTFVLDKYLRLSKNGIHFRIGSISISGLHAGKIMFRNVIYDNGDFTIKINDGHLLFKFWKPVENRHLDLSKKRASRLHLVLHGLHVNVYNNLTKYAEIARIRRFDWFFDNNNMGDVKRSNNKPPDTSAPSTVWENIWNLLGIVNIEVSSGCLLVGNMFLPYALWTRFENFTSKTSVGESQNDRALLTFEGETENVSVSLIKNEEFKVTEKDKLQEPPRTTGNDGFPLLQTASLNFVYKQDLLGYVTDDVPQSITSKVPVWTSEWKFGDNTVLSYGPWAEQQRVLIYSFFYPPDYQTVPATVMPSRGQKRIHVRHDVNIILTKESCMDIWFMRNGQLESIRTRCGPQSNITMSILWITTEKGFNWKMQAEFLNFETTTSLLFTKLLECQKFMVKGKFDYPLTWNGDQLWNLEYTFYKAAAWFVWDHKRLFTDLINDWMGEEPSDITKFVPFRVFNKMQVVDSFEVIMLLNECNWVDTADKNDENVEVAIVGEKLTFECELPFIDFLPPLQKLKYHMKGENGIALRGRYPPDSATEPIRAALCRLARCTPHAPPSTFGTYSLDKDTWFEMWRTEKIVMNFDHSYRPIVIRKNIPSDIPFSVLSEYLPEPAAQPWALDPDYLGVEIIIEGSDVKFTGLLVKLIFELKNNYFGWYDSMTSIDSMNDPSKTEDVTKIRSAFDRVPINANVELYRTMDCDVIVRVFNVRADLLIYSPAMDPDEEPDECPTVFVEEVTVEVKKTRTQSLIQVGISPACAYLGKSSAGTTAGCITLSGLQFRGHAMYSPKEVTWDMGIVEYGWIMEILVGDINGTLDMPTHLLVLHQILESVMLFIISPDDKSKVPERMQFCQHGQLTKSCSISGKKNNTDRSTCRTEENLKYRQIRVSVDSVNLALVEEKIVLQVFADPIRVTVCNAHEGRFTEHVCVRVPGVKLKQAVRTGSREDDNWVEGASAEIEGISLDIELPNDLNLPFDLEKERCDFIKFHDEDTKRLHFVWSEHSVWGCACFGNTAFFGNFDTIGSTFMETVSKRKFFVPGIEPNPELQPRVLQSVLDKTKCVLTAERHLYYRKPRKNEKNGSQNRKGSSTDTGSFHSAKSRQFTGRRLLQSNEMTSTYSEFINNLSVIIPDCKEPPAFGEPGDIAKWCQLHPATIISNNSEKRGVNDVKFSAKHKKTENIFNVVDRRDSCGEPSVEYDTNRGLYRNKRRLAVSGTAATSLDVFLSPIGLEGLERIVTTTTHSIGAINPCLLVHVLYRECIVKKHRQPLTDSLFEEAIMEAEMAPDLEVLVDLPRINIGLFQCGLKKNVVKTNTNDHLTANLALILIDRASIQSELLVHVAEGSRTKTNLSTEVINTKSMVYHMKCNVITAQMLQLSNRDAADFGNSSSTTTSNNWEQCAISKRMPLLEPRVMMDFNISDFSVIMERRPITTTIVPVRANTMTTTAHSPVPVSLTPTAKTPEATTPLKKKNRVIYEHYLKAAIGSVTASVVMARPQELTAGDEFPIYEALAPVMVSWLSVLDNFAYSLNKLLRQWECWKNVALAKVLKLALDCTEEKVTVKMGKNRMACTRVLGAHQASCPSCLLLRTLFRWFAYSEQAPQAVSRRLDIRTEFEVEETRKTALMALLSHWQSDIGKQLKLVSYEDANKFRVTRTDEAAIVALTKLSRRGQKNKISAAKKETRIVMETNQKKANEKTKMSKMGRISPAPLLKKLRLKGGSEGDEEEDKNDYSDYAPMKKTNKKIEDIEMQEWIMDSGVISYEDDDDEEEDQVNTKKDQDVDLYTWMRNAQRESALRRRKGGQDTADSDVGLETPKEKEYINPMDIQQKAFYYTIYRWAKLQWSTLDNVESDHFHIDYSFLLRAVDVRMMAKSIKSSTDQKRQYITPDQQKVMQIRNAAVSGGMVWNLERDEKRKVPLLGQWNISYNGNVEGIRFLIGMATVSLGKELSLVLQAATEAKNELNLQSAAETTPQNTVKRWSVNTQYDQTAEWDEKVLDMTRDYEKHMKRMKASRMEGTDKVRLFVNGNAAISSVVLESVLNDLYVSAMILKIEVSHSKKPIPDIVAANNVTVTTLDERKTATLTRKPITSSSAVNSRIDDVSISLTKMSLTLSESDLNKKSDILRCSLNSSSLNYFTRVQPIPLKDGKPIKSASTNTPFGQNQQTLGSWATLKLGALEGNMPMAAHSLHDVVMRHGKELEQQFNRLSAQPASTPIGNPAGFSIIEEPLLRKASEKKVGSVKTPASPENLLESPKETPLKAVLTDAATVISTLRTAANEPKKHPSYQVPARRVPVAVINFVLEITSIEMNVQVLPSLQAKYKIYRASSNGVTGDKGKWTISVDEHFFEFCVTGQGGKTETFRLQLPSIKCTGHHSVEQGTALHKPSTDKKLIYREGGSLQMTVLLGPVNHTFTTELLNQLMFAENSFRAELTSLINRIRSSSTTTPTRSPMVSPPLNSSMTATSSSSTGSTSATNLKLNLPLQHNTLKTQVSSSSHNNEKPPLLFAIKVLTRDPKSPRLSPSPDKASQPWLQLTAATPTQTAVRLTIDSLEGELTNKWVVKEEGSKERIYGSAVVHFNAKLGQLVKAAQYEEVSSEMQEYATFMTQVRVENKERNMLNSAYSYHISLNRPILLVKAAAIDKAVLLWLNYKNTYDYWRDEKEKVVQEKTTAKQANSGTTANSMFSPSHIAEDADMNLSLAINNGMYMCMPLYSYDVTEGMPALVLSLQKSELSVLVKKELTCKASFNGFKMSFIDDFDEQALTQSFLDATHSEQSNCIFFPEGTYQLCSKIQATASNAPAKWVLSVSAEMQGVEIDLDQRIGKLAKLLVNTCSMIGKDDEDDISFWEDQKELDTDDEKVEGAAELKRLKAEERVPWMENKMHEHSRAVYELTARGVSTKKLEAEKHKLRQYELIRFKAFRRNMAEKLNRGNSTSSHPDCVTPLGEMDRRGSKPDTSSISRLAKTDDATQISQKNEPETVNFNLDVKLNITSGTCTLRTAKKEGTVQMNFPGQIGEALKRLNQGTRDIKAMFEPPTLTTTNFSIPSVEIKAYHVSDPDDTTTSKFGKKLEKLEKVPKGLGRDAEKLSHDLNSKSRFGRQPSKQTVNGSKRGCFYIFIGLASMPTETVVTPHLATYFEQVLEPLPPSAVFQSQNLRRSQEISTVDQKIDSKDEINNIVAMDTAALPIDFVLYLDVQSSTIRFDGKQQTTRNQAQADCLLTLPRLTLELTTKRTKDNIDSYVGGIYISGQFKGFMLKIYNPLEPELDSSRALQLSLDLLSFVISRNKNSSSEMDNRVRFVFTSQIGKASFEYNFRRLGELIQFPKPWYRAAIARRVFFGDQAAPRGVPRGGDDAASDVTGTTRSRIPTDKRNSQPPASIVSTASSNIHTHQSKPWTAVVLAALQWNEFEVTAFMSNTMGKTTWSASKGLLWADAKLNSAMERDVTVSFVLGSSELCAREGAISGLVKLNNLRISGAHSLSADLKIPPVHKAKLKVEWITANVEWMSRRVLIGKWTCPAFKVADFYKGLKEGEQISLASLGMNVEASWKNLQVVITKSTIDDIKAIVARLISFFEEQLKNSRLLLGNFSNTTAAKKQENIPTETRKPKTHFWEKVLDYVSEMQMNEQLMPLMELEGATVGGHVQLKAGGISLVLMKGDMNSDTWVIFHLQNACISFDPDAKMDFLDKESKQKIGIALKQKFTLQLGSKQEHKTENLANVCRVQSRSNVSRHMQKTDEILDYFIGEVLVFLGLQHDTQLVHAVSSNRLVEKASSINQADLQQGPSNSPTAAKHSSKTKSKHSVLELFQFPGLEAVMTTEQLNGLDDGDKYESAFQLPMEVFATVVCDFFSDVAIETDFNAQVSFLPELLKSYLKCVNKYTFFSARMVHYDKSNQEKPNINSAASSISSSTVTSTPVTEAFSLEEMKDPRQFICKEWIVDPRVRFIDKIKWKPPVVDEILKKLQIFDHRNTIPKVIQRVVLDPLDATLASSVIATLELIDNKRTIRKFKKSRADIDPNKVFPEEKNDVSIRINVPAMFAATPTGKSEKL